MRKQHKVAVVTDYPQDSSMLASTLNGMEGICFNSFQMSATESDTRSMATFAPHIVIFGPQLANERVAQLFNRLLIDNPMLAAIRIAPTRSEGKSTGVLIREVPISDLTPEVLGEAIESTLTESNPTAARPTYEVIIVDDDPDDQELYRRLLGRIDNVNYKITTADNGEQGLKEIESHDLDCMLLDYSLPGYNGLEILEKVRRLHPNLPVVLLTGQGNDRVAVQALRSGAQDYFSKSNVNGELLHQTIQNACERQALQIRVMNQADALSLFSRALAHDLKEPIHSVLSFCRLAAESEEIGDSPRQHLNTAISSAEHMNRLVDMVRTYTSLQNEQAASDRKSLQADAIVDQALKNLSKQLSEVPHEFETAELPSVRVDESLVTILFQNLISNALNYANNPVSKIKIHALRGEDFHTFTVADNGPGVDLAFTGQIFQPFKRLLSGKSRGSGLGLSICKKIVETHGGRIWIESNLGEGAQFHFLLPKGDESIAEPAASTGHRDHSEKKALRIANVLHVEDNPNDIYLTKMMLRKRDRVELNIYNVGNGQEAIEFIESKTNPQIDLILLDLNMPVMNGFEFLSHLCQTKLERDIPVIVCSTSNDPSDQRRTRELGAKGYAIKPIDLAKLEPAIRSLDTFTLNQRDEHTCLEVVSYNS